MSSQQWDLDPRLLNWRVTAASKKELVLNKRFSTEHIVHLHSQIPFMQSFAFLNYRKTFVPGQKNTLRVCRATSELFF